MASDSLGRNNVSSARPAMRVWIVPEEIFYGEVYPITSFRFNFDRLIIADFDTTLFDVVHDQ